MTAAEARKKALGILETRSRPASHPASNPTFSLDISVILSALLGVQRSFLVAHPERELSQAEEKAFFSAIADRSRGLPVAYITGTKEFWGLPFHVTPDVLIPKPDTEILVERAVSLAAALHARSGGRPVRVLDVCTGSGCIAVSIAVSCPFAEVTATDISPAALAVARENAETLLPAGTGSAHRIIFEMGDLRNGLPEGPFDLVVSNPPYVPAMVARELLADGRNEPILALDGGEDGLDLVRALIDSAGQSLAQGGRILIETGEYNAGAAAGYLNTAGFTAIVIHRDLENQERVIEGTLA